MIPFTYRIALLLIVGAAYAAYDLFNKRNVPDLFVYGVFILGLAITFTYGLKTIEISLAISFLIIALGYLIYKKGIMGAGDFMEFATISMLLPIQPNPMLSSLPQFNLPFILSVLISTGYSAIILTTVYYLAKSLMKGGLKTASPKRKKIYHGAGLFISYLILLLLISYLAGFKVFTAIIILTMGAASSLAVIFEKEINMQMVSYMYPKDLSKEDMIATNLMSNAELKYFSSKSKHFGRLVTSKMLNETKAIKKKIPVYTSGIPLAFFALIGIVISVLFGNLLIYFII